jgi:hypothetical protein
VALRADAGDAADRQRPPPSSDAYVDTLLEVDYLCAEGHAHRFEGPEHLFDVTRATTIHASSSSAAARNGPIAAPLDDFQNPAYGHAPSGSTSPFTLLD